MKTPDVSDSSRRKWEWIKYQLRLRGYSLGSLSREKGLSRNAVARLLYRPWPRVERAIAEKLEIPPEILWPDRYDENGRPLTRAWSWAVRPPGYGSFIQSAPDNTTTDSGRNGDLEGGK